MGARSRRKGAAFERWLAHYLNATIPGASARRGIQYRDGGKEACDVVSELPLHIECKHGKKPNLRRALDQARNDAERGRWAAAVCKDDNAAPVVLMSLEDWADLMREWWEMRRR